MAIQSPLCESGKGGATSVRTGAGAYVGVVCVHFEVPVDETVIVFGTADLQTLVVSRYLEDGSG